MLVEIGLLTLGPLAVDAVGDGRQPRIAGTWFARLLAPFAVALVAGLVVLAIRQRRRVRSAAWIAHGGVVVLLLGVLGSTFDRSASATIDLASAVRIAGVEVRNLGVDVEPGGRPGSTAVVARLELDGHRVAPALVAHPDRGGVLAETAMVSRPWRDIQVALVRADDAGRVLVEVRTKPLVQLIWVGALLIVAGALLGVRPPRAARAGGATRAVGRRPTGGRAFGRAARRPTSPDPAAGPAVGQAVEPVAGPAVPPGDRSRRPVPAPVGSAEHPD